MALGLGRKPGMSFGRRTHIKEIMTGKRHMRCIVYPGVRFDVTFGFGRLGTDWAERSVFEIFTLSSQENKRIPNKIALFFLRSSPFLR